MTVNEKYHNLFENHKPYSVTTQNLTTDEKFTLSFRLYSEAIDHYRQEAKNIVDTLSYFSGNYRVNLSADNVLFNKEIIISAAYEHNKQ